MTRQTILGLAGAALLAGSASAQSYFGDDGPGWGPAYRPESSFVEPGYPPTPGQIAGAAYRARTGRPVYPTFEPGATGAVRDVYEAAPRRVYRQRVVKKRPVVRQRVVERRVRYR